MRVHWRHLANTIQLVLPSAHPSPQPKRQIDLFNRFCTAHGRASSGTSAPPGEYDWNCAHLRHLANAIEFFLPSTHQSAPTQTANRSVQQFSRALTESPYTLQWATLSIKIAPSHEGIWTPSNTWFIGPIRAQNPNGISMGSAFLNRWLQSVPLERPFPPPNCPYHGGLGNLKRHRRTIKVVQWIDNSGSGILNMWENLPLTHRSRDAAHALWLKRHCQW